jgi:WD40 repeat protein
MKRTKGYYYQVFVLFVSLWFSSFLLTSNSLRNAVSANHYAQKHRHWISSIAFSPDGNRVLSGSWDNTVRLWDMKSGEEIWNFTGHTNRITSVDLSHDGKHAISGSSDGTVRLLDLKSGKELRRFTEQKSYVGKVAFSPDGKRAISADGKIIHLWNFAIPKCWTPHIFVGYIL